MRLSDIMGNLDLSFFPQVALIIFLCVFAAVSIRLITKRTRCGYEELANLPLATDDTTTGAHQ
ncbi:MAG: hypothetical protein H6815_14475 [Phycisphaeraceae bacterium]|nr:hypothetical protein [Phycisphaerales bacterium]MCB9861645.1 hypothetical protein [Phycisphaeraceae bacterium]